jgi:D-arabinose 1-dehydrogenase-like Zn-dependent alcohol dehydrogenase
VVEVHAVTVNRTRDLNVIGGEVGGEDVLPLVPGQDPAGRIVAVGAGVDPARIWERVIVTSRMTCGTCQACRSGLGSDCPRSTSIGIHRWGGYAERVVVPVTQVFAVADALGFAEAAVAMRHFPMAMQQLGPTKADLKSGEWILVMGAAGGLGSACVQVARARGAHVIAGAGADDRVAAAMALGAHHGINYRKQDLPARVRELTGGRGVDVVCENISDPTTFPAAFRSLATMGRMVTSGAHGGGTVPVDMKRLYQSRLRIIGAAGYDPGDVATAMALAGRGELKATVDKVMALDELTEAFRLIDERQVTGKIVIDPQR